MDVAVEHTDIPACMYWPIPPVVDEAAGDEDAIGAIWRWQQARCAICGADILGRRRSILDHDHETGIVRGYVCPRCNVQEGAGSTPRLVRWRAGWNPAALLGVTALYSRSPLERTPQFSGDELRAAINLLPSSA